MASRDFAGNYEQTCGLQEVRDLMDKVDLNDPEKNIITKEMNTYELLKIQAEVQAKALNDAVNVIKTMVPLAEIDDQNQIIAEEPGGKVTVQAQQDYLTAIAEKNSLVTRMLQQRHQEKNNTSWG